MVVATDWVVPHQYSTLLRSDQAVRLEDENQKEIVDQISLLSTATVAGSSGVIVDYRADTSADNPADPHFTDVTIPVPTALPEAYYVLQVGALQDISALSTTVSAALVTPSNGLWAPSMGDIIVRVTFGSGAVGVLTGQAFVLFLSVPT